MKSSFFPRYVSGYIFYYNIDMTNREYILTKKNRQPMISQGLTASHLIVGATGFEPATSASRTQRSTKPVSYTHLQKLLTQNSLTFYNIFFFRSTSIVTMQISSVRTQTVSYTHLDVYKRQDFNAALFSFLFNLKE